MAWHGQEVVARQADEGVVGLATTVPGTHLAKQEGRRKNTGSSEDTLPILQE